MCLCVFSFVLLYFPHYSPIFLQWEYKFLDTVKLFSRLPMSYNKNKWHYLHVFFAINPKYYHTTEHTYTRLTFVVSLVDNEFSSKTVE